MKVLLVTPEPPRSAGGNGVTTRRWAAILRGLGHTVQVDRAYRRQPVDLLIALHARRSHASVARWRGQRGDAPLVVALTGTDLYRDLPDDPDARSSLRLADRLVLLQVDGLRHLPRAARNKAHVILQSARAPSRRRRPDPDAFEVGVLANLRPVKDALRAARAARLLPRASRIRVVHVGAALTPEQAEAAGREARDNPRYTWRGGLTHAAALRWLSGCRLLALTLLAEGGANVIAEALVCGVPVIATRISGTLGMLGADYPGLVPPGETRPLARLLKRVEAEPDLLAELRARCAALAPRFAPEAERDAWKALLAEL